MTEDFERDYPDWLENVALRVNELGADPAVFGRFSRMLRTWYVEHEAGVPKLRTDKPGYALHNEVKLLPLRNITLAHKYAVLTAIHDVICDGVKRMDLWGVHRKLKSISKAKSGMPYTMLKSLVNELSELDRPRIKKILKDVEADLIALTEDESSAPSQTHTESSVEPAGAPAEADAPSQSTHEPANGDTRRKSAPVDGAINAECPNPPEPEFVIGPDARSLKCNSNGTVYNFTLTQSKVVRRLFDNWESGLGDISDQYLLETAEIPGNRLADTFRYSRAWGTIIVQGNKKGTRQLATPSNS